MGKIEYNTGYPSGYAPDLTDEIDSAKSFALDLTERVLRSLEKYKDKGETLEDVIIDYSKAVDLLKERLRNDSNE